MTVVQFASAPPNPRNHWIERWVSERMTPSVSTVMAGLHRLRASEPLATTSYVPDSNVGLDLTS